MPELRDDLGGGMLGVLGCFSGPGRSRVKTPQYSSERSVPTAQMPDVTNIQDSEVTDGKVVDSLVNERSWMSSLSGNGRARFIHFWGAWPG